MTRFRLPLHRLETGMELGGLRPITALVGAWFFVPLFFLTWRYFTSPAFFPSTLSGTVWWFFVWSKPWLIFMNFAPALWALPAVSRLKRDRQTLAFVALALVLNYAWAALPPQGGDFFLHHPLPPLLSPTLFPIACFAAWLCGLRYFGKSDDHAPVSAMNGFRPYLSFVAAFLFSAVAMFVFFEILFGSAKGEAGGMAAGIFIGVVLVFFPVKGFYFGMALAPLVHHIRRPLGALVYVALGALIACGNLIEIWRWPTPDDIRMYGPPLAGVLIYGAALLATRRRRPQAYEAVHR